MASAAPEPRAAFSSVFDLAAAWPLDSHAPDAASAKRVLQVTSTRAECQVSDGLSARYGTGIQQQLVASFTNRITFEQAWFNAVRASKPQTFTVAAGAASAADAVAACDTTGGPTGSCDFCKWATNTADDVFPRIETEVVVTASNLFKYCAPHHGLLLFKHHDPLSFSAPDIQQLLHAGARWFDAAAAVAGSSANGYQTAADGGDAEAEAAGCKGSAAATPVRPLKLQRRLWPMLLWNTLPRAGASQFHGHAQVALSEVPFPSDMLMMAAATQHEAAYGTCCYEDTRRAHAAAGLAHEVGPPEDRAWVYASLTPRKDCELVVHGVSLESPTFAAALHAALRALVDELGCQSFNAAVQPMWDRRARESAAPQPFADCRVVARLLSRGKLSSRASDFGGLEVFGGASIGQTDPYTVHAAVGRRLTNAR